MLLLILLAAFLLVCLLNALAMAIVIIGLSFVFALLLETALLAVLSFGQLTLKMHINSSKTDFIFVVAFFWDLSAIGNVFRFTAALALL